LSKRGVVLGSMRKLHALRESDCKLLVRVDGYVLAGIVTKIKRVYDSQIGRDRRWALGVTMEGNIFEEPLDRKNPQSGRLEDCVQRETEFMMYTARKTFDSTDKDANFSWLPHQFSLDNVKGMEDEVDGLRRVNLRMDDQHKADRKRMELLEQDAGNSSERNKNLRETVYHITRKLNELEMENQGMYTLLMKLRGHGLVVEGELSVEVSRALEKGKERAMNAHELRIMKLREDEEERQQVRGTFPATDAETMRNAIKDVVEETVDKKNASMRQQGQGKPKPKPLVKEGEYEVADDSGGGDT